MNIDDLGKIVTPAKAGVQKTYNYFKILDSGFRRNDVCWVSATFYELVTIKINRGNL
jgi:hypothetical protein